MAAVLGSIAATLESPVPFHRVARLATLPLLEFLLFLGDKCVKRRVFPRREPAGLGKAGEIANPPRVPLGNLRLQPGGALKVLGETLQIGFVQRHVLPGATDFCSSIRNELNCCFKDRPHV